MTLIRRTKYDLAATGYVYIERGPCKMSCCRADVLWYRNPKGRPVAIDPDTLEPHWATCHAIDQIWKRNHLARTGEK